MAYGFEKRIAEKDNDVKTYLDEGMYFEAWIMIIRHWTGKTFDDWQVLYDKMYQEFNKKSTCLTNDEMLSLDYEYFDYRMDAIGV